MSRNMNLSLTLNARDQTQSAIASALGGLGKVLSFAKNSAVGLAGINLGVRPLVAGLDNLIDRGTRLEVIRKQFSSLTGKQDAGLDLLAKRLQIASSGTLRLGQSMEIANRGLAMGVGFKQIVTAAEFATKKAAAIGEEPAQLLERIVNDLGKGTTRVLDDLGLLRGGVEDVARAYNAIHGAKAFAGLDEAAQKSVIAQAAIAEMSRSMKSLGVTGEETFFTWQGIKTQIGDATDKLILAVTSSEAMKGAIGGLSTFLKGVSEHFENGGTFGQLLFGKGKSGGLAGVLGGALQDAGDALWSGFSKGIPAMWDSLVGTALPKLASWRDELIEKLAGVMNDWIPKIEEWRQKLIDGLANVLKPLTDILEKLMGMIPQPLKDNASANVGGTAGQLQQLWKNITGLAGGSIDPVEFLKSRWERRPPADARDAIGPQSRAGGRMFIPGMGVIPLGDLIGAGAIGVVGAASPSNMMRNATDFAAEFAPTPPAKVVQEADDAARLDELRALSQGAYRLNPSALLRAKHDFARSQRAVYNYSEGISTQGMRDRGLARKIAQARAAELLKQGFRLTGDQKQQLFWDARDLLTSSGVKRMEEARREMAKGLDIQGFIRTGKDPGNSQYAAKTAQETNAPPWVAAFLERIKKQFEEYSKDTKELIKTLGASGREIARAAG